MKSVLNIIIILILVTLTCVDGKTISAENSSGIEGALHYKTALAFLRRNNTEKAIEELEKAVEAQPSNDLFLYNLGTLYLNQKEYNKAVVTLEKAVNNNANSADYFYNLGLAAYLNKNYFKAINNYKNAIALNRYDINFYINLGLAYRAAKLPDKALEQYQKALQINPNSIPALINLGVIYTLQDNVSKAKETFEKILEVEPGNKEAAYNLSLIKNRSKTKNNPETKSARTVFTDKSNITGLNITEPLNIKLDKKDTHNNSLVALKPVLKKYPEIKKVKQAPIKKSELKPEEMFEKKLKDFTNNKPANPNSVENRNDLQTELDQFKEKLLSDFSKKIQDTVIKQSEMTDKLKMLESETKLEMANFKEKISNTVSSGIKDYLSKQNIQILDFKKDILSVLDLLIQKVDNLNKRLDNFQPAPAANNMEVPLQSSIENSEMSLPGQYEPVPELNNMQSDELTIPSDLDLNNLDMPESLNLAVADDYMLPSLPQSSGILNISTVNINTASKNELISAGFPSSIAENIVWHRDNISPFKSNEDIVNVAGITIDIYNSIKNKITY